MGRERTRGQVLRDVHCLQVPLVRSGGRSDSCSGGVVAALLGNGRRLIFFFGFLKDDHSALGTWTRGSVVRLNERYMGRLLWPGSSFLRRCRLMNLPFMTDCVKI